MKVRTVADITAAPPPGRSHIVAFGRTDGAGREPLVVDTLTASILELSDGTRTAMQIVGELNRTGRVLGEKRGLDWIEELFLHGLLSLRDQRLDAAGEGVAVADLRRGGQVPAEG